MSLVGLLGTMATIAGCLPAPEPDPGPAATVLELHRRFEAGDLASAHDLIDYRHRLEEVLGDSWLEGDDDGRARLEGVIRAMSEETTRRHWGARMAGRTPRFVERFQGPVEGWGAAELGEGKGEGDANDRFAFRYRLHRKEAGWRVTLREVALGKVESDSTGFWKVALGRIRDELGHRPDPGEVADRLPEWAGRIRQHTYILPKLGGSP